VGVGVAEGTRVGVPVLVAVNVGLGVRVGVDVIRACRLGKRSPSEHAARVKIKNIETRIIKRDFITPP